MHNTHELSSLELNQLIIDNIQTGLIVIIENKLTYCNQRFVDIVGANSINELLGKNIDSFLPDIDKQWILERHQQRASGRKLNTKTSIPLQRLSDKQRITATLSIGISQTSSGQLCMVATIEDTSEEEILTEKLSLSEYRLERMLNSLPDIFYKTDAQGIFLTMSGPIYDLIGYTPEECVGKSITSFMSGKEDERQLFLKALQDNQGKATQIEWPAIHKNGHKVWVSLNAQFHYDKDGNYAGVEGIPRDITKQREEKINLIQLATQDSLTGLLNRTGFNTQAKIALEKAKREDAKLSFFYIDLDNFKPINDSFGHNTGDEVLIEVGKRLKLNLRDNDIIARLGGDEFIIIMKQNISKSDVHETAKRIINNLAGHFKKGIHIQGSIGISQYPDDGYSIEALINIADTSMYKAKVKNSHK